VRGAGRHGSVACRVAQRAQPGAFRFVFTLVNGGIDPFRGEAFWPLNCE